MSGPPLGPTFSVSGRPAAGLYAGAWFGSLIGIGLLLVALLASIAGNVRGAVALAVAAFAVFFVAAVLAGGYQGIRRRSVRPAERYRGPSPFLVFAAVFAAANAAGGIVALATFDTPLELGPQTLVSVAVVVPLYAGLVWLLVAREGALSWREMGWPTSPDGLRRALGPFAYGVALTIPVLVVTVVVAGLLATALGVSPPPILPLPDTVADWALDIVVAVILAPLGEELFFRGFAQSAWARDLGWRSAVVRTAIFFSLVHAISIGGADLSEALRLALVAAVARLPVALGLGWAFARTGAIAAPLGLHAAFNGLMLVLATLVPLG